ncbi:MAG: Asp23/Gls24 family envelope stress response protein [Mogibacterium sp.]|nr:Asp23/Gls24 family envelope stress response protein [Mogibacterium sp.]
MSKEGKLIKLIAAETLKFEGVSKKRPSVKISEEDDEYIINLGILVDYGVNIPQLSYDIQTGLIHSMMEHEGIVVKTVNIRVEGIFDK